MRLSIIWNTINFLSIGTFLKNPEENMKALGICRRTCGKDKVDLPENVYAPDSASYRSQRSPTEWWDVCWWCAAFVDCDHFYRMTTDDLRFVGVVKGVK